MIRIFVVTYNGREALIRCITTLLAVPAGAPFVVTIYDNGSSDGTAEWLRENCARGFEFERLEHNLGFSGAANVAARNAKEDILVFLDDDVFVVDGWLASLQAQLLSSPRIGIVGCRLIDEDSRVFFAELRAGPLRNLRRNEINCGQGEYVKDTDVLPGTCWMMRRELFYIVGNFNEEYFPSQFEDFDYCLRTRLAGFRIVYLGTLTLVHLNLHRGGGRATHQKNRNFFYAEWRKQLAEFPLPSSHPVDHLMTQAIASIDQGDFDAALDRCAIVRAIDSRFAEPQIEFSAYLKSGEKHEAWRIAGDLLRLNPMNLFVRFSLLNHPVGEEDLHEKLASADRILDAIELQVRKGIS